jgi:hypothetical protein
MHQRRPQHPDGLPALKRDKADYESRQTVRVSVAARHGRGGGAVGRVSVATGSRMTADIERTVSPSAADEYALKRWAAHGYETAKTG